MKIKITADSTCDLSEELLKKWDIALMPMHILMGEDSYLDGVTVHHLGEEFKDMGKKKKFHATKSIVDFADERIISFEELEPEERIYCSMLSNLILGAALLIISLIAGAV